MSCKIKRKRKRKRYYGADCITVLLPRSILLELLKKNDQDTISAMHQYITSGRRERGERGRGRRRWEMGDTEKKIKAFVGRFHRRLLCRIPKSSRKLSSIMPSLSLVFSVGVPSSLTVKSLLRQIPVRPNLNVGKIRACPAGRNVEEMQHVSFLCMVEGGRSLATVTQKFPIRLLSTSCRQRHVVQKGDIG